MSNELASDAVVRKDGIFSRLFGIDLRSLAAFRIGIALVILADVILLRFSELEMMYSDQGMYTIADSLRIQAGDWPWSLHYLNGSIEFQGFLFFVAGVFALMHLAEYSMLMRPASHATLVLELLGPLVIWSPWRTGWLRMAMVIAFFGLHIGIELLFTPLMLSYVCMAAWLLVLPREFWEFSWVRRSCELIAKPLGGDPFARGSFIGQTAGSAAEIPASGWRRVVRRTGDVLGVALIVYVLLWNVATFDQRRFAFLVPTNIRWVAHVTLVRQTWDMFYVPSQHNGWFVACTRLADGREIDALRNGEPIEWERPSHNWWYLTNPRSKMFVRRLDTARIPAMQSRTAEYLLRKWNQSHTGADQAVSVDLIYFHWLEGYCEGPRDFTSDIVATAETEEFERKNRLPPSLEAFGDLGLGLP